MEWISQTLIAPLLRRGGSMFAGYMATIGASAEGAAAIGAGAVALGGVAVDLGLSWANKKGWI